MDNKGINGRGLSLLWGQSKETFATKEELQNLSESVSDNTLVVTFEKIGEEDSNGNTPMRCTHTFEQIKEAYKSGKCIIAQYDTVNYTLSRIIDFTDGMMSMQFVEFFCWGGIDNYTILLNNGGPCTKSSSAFVRQSAVRQSVIENDVNPISSGAVYEALQNLPTGDSIEPDATPTKDSTNTVTSGGVYNAIEEAKEELQEAINNIPSGGGGEGGSAVQEIVYMDCSVSLMPIGLSTSTTYDDIASWVDSGKYVVGKASYAMVAAEINTAYLPLSALNKETREAIFKGLIAMPNQNTGVVMTLDMTAIIRPVGAPELTAKVVSVTSL